MLYLSVIAAFIILTVALLLITLTKTKKQKTSPPLIQESKPTIVITSRDIKAIAGDNVMSTQLDLARAYVEMGKISLAKQILNHVIQHGDEGQQQEARVLINLL